MHCASLSDAIGYLDMFKCNIAFNFPDACSCTKDDREVVVGWCQGCRGHGDRAQGLEGVLGLGKGTDCDPTAAYWLLS